MAYEPSPEQIQVALDARRAHNYTYPIKGTRTKQTACKCGEVVNSNFWEHQMEEILKAVFNLAAANNKRRREESYRAVQSYEYPYGRGNQGPGTGPDGERLI